MTHRTIHNDWHVLEPMTLEAQMEQVQKLPAHEPGVVVTIPLMLWPLYQQLHRLEPALYRNSVLQVKKAESL